MKEADWVNATATKTSAEELDPLPLLYQASPVKREGSTKKEPSAAFLAVVGGKTPAQVLTQVQVVCRRPAMYSVG